MPKIEILFLAGSLQRAGAERQLVNLAKGLKEAGRSVGVAVFYGGGDFEKDCVAAGIPLIHLEKRGRWDNFRVFFRLRHLIRRHQVEVLHGYLTGPNLAALGVGIFRPKVKVVWGIRSSDQRWLVGDRFGKIATWLESKLSTWVDLVIINSERGRDVLIEKGYRKDNIQVIRNGIEIQNFKPDPEARVRLRQKLGIPDSMTVIGSVARPDPVKNYPLLFEAADLFRKDFPNVAFLCAGWGGSSHYELDLRDLLSKSPVHESVFLLNKGEDVNAVYNAMDLFTLFSISEGFPNCLAEAMACGVRCVSTDVGDARMILGTLGIVVPEHTPEKLAGAWMQGLKTDPAVQAPLLRSRIADLCDLSRLVSETDRCIREIR